MEADSGTEIDAPIEEVFAIVADLERLPEWQPDVRRCECLERDPEGRPRRVEMVLDTVVRQARARLLLTYDSPTVISWVMESGDVRAFEGSWTLSALDDDRTLAVYAVKIDFGRTMGLLMRGPAAKMGASVVSSMPGKLKRFVEREPTLDRG